MAGRGRSGPRFRDIASPHDSCAGPTCSDGHASAYGDAVCPDVSRHVFCRRTCRTTSAFISGGCQRAEAPVRSGRRAGSKAAARRPPPRWRVSLPQAFAADARACRLVRILQLGGVHGVAIRRRQCSVGCRTAPLHWPRRDRGLARVHHGLARLRRPQLQGARPCRDESRQQGRHRLPLGEGPRPDRTQVRGQVRGLRAGRGRGPDLHRIHLQVPARQARGRPGLAGWRALAHQVHRHRPHRAVERPQRWRAGAPGRPHPRGQRGAGQRRAGARGVLEDGVLTARPAPWPADEPDVPRLLRRGLQQRGVSA
mmetsp:Transcript_7640/g.21755  ORF Transcript_7640/g.21755 Transcript_7640/m.21755 type:complete len:311 (-) Transcript_7640:10-942(-)